MEYKIRPYQSGEEEYVADLHRRLYSEEYGWGPAFINYAVEIPRHFERKERDPREEMFVAEKDGRPVGSIMLCVTDDPDVAQLRVFAVEKEFRRRGIGEALLQAALETAEIGGFRKVILWTADAVSDALHKYEKTGFRYVESVENLSWRPDGKAVYEIKMEKDLA